MPFELPPLSFELAMEHFLDYLATQAKPKYQEIANGLRDSWSKNHKLTYAQWQAIAFNIASTKALIPAELLEFFTNHLHCKERKMLEKCFELSKQAIEQAKSKHDDPR